MNLSLTAGKFKTLLLREYWENKGAFRITPISIGLVAVGFMLMGITLQSAFDNNDFTFREGLRYLATQPEELRGMLVTQSMMVISTFFILAMSIVTFFYLLGSLYDDRKDRSILFWKSLPASDSLTIASKLFSAMFVIPLFFWVVLIITEIIMMGIGMVMIWSVDQNPWSLLFGPAQPLKAWGIVLLGWLANSIWMLPMYGWLLLVSASVPKAPMLFAILPPILLSILQAWISFLEKLQIPDNAMGLIKDWIVNSPAILTWGVSTNAHGSKDIDVPLGFQIGTSFDNTPTVANMFARLVSIEMLYGLLLTGVFLALTFWFRRRATDG